MALEVKLPDLGEGIKSGDVLDVLVNVGDTVAKSQGLIEIETDKATVEVPSPAAGTVVRVLVSKGQTIPTGTTIVELESSDVTSASGMPTSAQPSAAAAPSSSQPAAPDAKVSGSGQAEPQATAPPMPAAPPTSNQSRPPAATSSPAPTAPTAPPGPPGPTAPSAPATSAAPTGSAGAAPAATAAAPDQPAEVGVADGEIAAAGPAVRRLAREVGVDLRRVVGSGPNGRITREDVMAVVRSAGARAAAPTAPTQATTPPSESSTPAPVATQPAAGSAVPGAAPPSTAPLPVGAGSMAPTAPATAEGSAPADETSDREAQTDAWGPIEVERATRIRRVIAAKMSEAWSTVPRVSNFDDADVTELERIRESSKADYLAAGVKLTSLPFVIKAVALALRSHPMLNASLHLEHELIIYKKYVNIGIAVDTDRGLVVPSLRNADRMTIPQMARALADLAESARSNNFKLDDLRGSTFTISNLGAVGGTYSTPIVNFPEVAILLVGRSRKMPVVVDDQLAIRLMMPLSLSYDHRLVDGAAAARFLNDVIAYLEAPSRLFLAP